MDNDYHWVVAGTSRYERILLTYTYTWNSRDIFLIYARVPTLTYALFYKLKRYASRHAASTQQYCRDVIHVNSESLSLKQSIPTYGYDTALPVQAWRQHGTSQWVLRWLILLDHKTDDVDHPYLAPLVG
jgi:hypothetical protein